MHVSAIVAKASPAPIRVVETNVLAPLIRSRGDFHGDVLDRGMLRDWPVELELDTRFGPIADDVVDLSVITNNDLEPAPDTALNLVRGHYTLLAWPWIVVCG